MDVFILIYIFVYVTSNNAPQPSYQVLHANNPAVAPKYEAPKPKFQRERTRRRASAA